MNKQEEHIKKNIAKSYGIDIEKARGKTKKIGELDKSGKNIKTANGWVPVRKHGSTSIKKEAPSKPKRAKGRSYEEIQISIDSANQSIKADRASMNDAKSEAAKEPFNEELVASMKWKYNSYARYIKTHEAAIEDYKKELVQAIGNEPIKMSTPEELKATARKLYQYLGFDLKKLDDQSGPSYSRARLTIYESQFDPKSYMGGKGKKSFSISDGGNDVNVSFNKKGQMYTERPHQFYHGQVNASGSYWRVGSSNPFWHSDMPTQTKNVKTIKQMGDWMKQMSIEPKKSSGSYYKGYADYLKAGGRDWD